MTIGNDPLRDVLSQLENVKQSGTGYTAKCPAHDDRSPSLSIATGDDGRVLLRCMAGCPTTDVLAALGLSIVDLFADSPRDNRPRRRMPWTGFVTAAKRMQREEKVVMNSSQPIDGFVTAAKRMQRERPTIDLLDPAKRWYVAGRERLPKLAEALGVSLESLDRLRVGFATRDDLAAIDTGCRGSGAWTWPMRDAAGGVVGVRLRADDGRKFAVRGSRQGLFLAPRPDAREQRGPLFVVEGASDTAALLTLGLNAVGLPSAGQGGSLLLDWCRESQPTRVLLLADGDDAGRAGMDAVARELASGGVPCRVCGVPGGAKDARKYLNVGGTAEALTALLDMPAGKAVTL